MAEEKILVTDLNKELGNQALVLFECEPFIKWILQQSHAVIEHDASAILLFGQESHKFYLRLGSQLTQDYLADFKDRAIEDLSAFSKRDLKGSDFEFMTYSSETQAQPNPQDQVKMLSFHSAPLIVREKILGIFAISSRKPDLFLVYRLNMFNVLAGQVALAIDSLQAKEQVVAQARIIERDSINMRNAFSGMSEGLIMIDEFDKIILSNPMARKMVGAKDESSDKELQDFVTKTLGPIFKDQASQDKKIIRKEFEFDKPWKMILRIEATAARDHHARKIGMVVMMRDITHEKEVDRMKTEFVSVVSHELRTPLTTIRESVSQVLDGILGPTTQEQNEFLSMCLEDIDRLTRIINDLLDISKIEAKKLDVKKQIVDYSAFVKSISLFFGPRLKEKGLEFKTVLSSEGLEGYFDKDKIIQVINNLIGNALKFTEKGFIELKVEEKDDSVECSIFDTGRGISQEDIARVFNKFEQFGRTDGPGQKGTGLGLAIAKGLVELHYGAMRVESKLGEWTRFSFVLPRYVNDGFIEDFLEKKIAEAKRDSKELSLFSLSLLNPKKLKEELAVNEFYGLNIRILDQLKSIIKGHDFISAAGKIFVLAEVKKSEAVEIAEKIKAQLSYPLKMDAREISVEVSLGYYSYPEDSENPKDLLCMASSEKGGT